MANGNAVLESAQKLANSALNDGLAQTLGPILGKDGHIAMSAASMLSDAQHLLNLGGEQPEDPHFHANVLINAAKILLGDILRRSSEAQNNWRSTNQ